MEAASTIRFSVCIPVYEGRALLPATLASLRAQTHADWELVVVEDGSREPVRDLVEAFAAEVSQKVIYHANPKNLGLPLTRDVALSLASNTWVALLDADDLWLPDHLAAIAATAARDAGLEFIFSAYRTFSGPLDDTCQLFSPTPAQRDHLREALFFCKLQLQPSCFAFRATLLERTGPWARGVDRLPPFLAGHSNYGEDRNFIMRSLHVDARMAWTGRITSGYRRHPGSMTIQNNIGLIYRAAYFNIYGPLTDLPQRAQRRFIAYLQANAARDCLAFGRSGSEAAWFYWRAWCWYPLRVDRLLHAVRSKLRRR